MPPKSASGATGGVSSADKAGKSDQKKEAKSPAKGSNGSTDSSKITCNKKGLYAAIAVLVVLILGLGGGLVYFAFFVEEEEPDCDDEVKAAVEECEEEYEAAAEEEEEEDGNPCEGCEVEAEPYPQHELDMGSGTIMVPKGWYVSEIVQNYEISPEELLDHFVGVDKEGWYPIYDKSRITFSNGASSFTISETMGMIYGPWGANFDDMPAGYEIVKEPTDDKTGIGRKKSGATYEYIEVYKCSDPGMCGDYAVVVGEPFTRKGVFTGSSADLATANKLFEDTILKENFPAVE